MGSTFRSTIAMLVRLGFLVFVPVTWSQHGSSRPANTNPGSLYMGSEGSPGTLGLDESNYDLILDESPRGEVERLLRDHKQNQDLVRNLGSRYYQVVYPLQVGNREMTGVSTREINTFGATFGGRGVNEPPDRAPISSQKHFRRTSLLIRAFQHKFILEMELNTRLLAPNIRQKEFLQEGAVSVTQEDLEHCYYHATVKDYSGSEFIPGSMAALHTCNGVSGIVHLGNETFVIQPFYGGDLSSKHPHVIYEYSDKSPQGCAVTGNYDAPSIGRKRKRRNGSTTTASPLTTPGGLDQIFNLTSRNKRDVRTVKKFIEVALVLDKAMFDLREESSRKEVIHDAIQVANIADLYFKNSLNTRLSLVYIETWQDQNQAAGFARQRSINQALVDFSDYVGRKLYKIDRDTTQLLTGQKFDGGRSTISTVGTICAGKAVGISVDIDIFEPHILAANLAHAIGHNLGFRHDEDGASNFCGCQDWHGCIMKPTVIGEEGIQPYKFSACSSEQFQQWMGDGHALCLLNKPNQLADFGSCGNGVIDDGEDCDCGSTEECESKDPCCDPVTCRLKRESECSTGPCCDSCKLRPAGFPCRESNNECDLTEICTGFSGQCPPDLFVKNAVPCHQGKGYCFNGDCPLMTDQCQAIWGRMADKAEESCFQQFNTGGTFNGNCGKIRFSGQYKPCEQANIECGTLHCQGGNNKPTISQGTYTTHTQTFNGKEVHCKIMGTEFNDMGEDYGMIQDGTRCGNEMICLNQSCISIRPMMSYTRCPADSQNIECAGRGICSNMNTCVCAEGFTGPDCSKVSTTLPPPFYPPTLPPMHPTPVSSFIDVTPSNTYILKESDSDTIIMVVILVASVGTVFMLFALMALCYRRKSAMPKYEPPYMKRNMMRGYSHPNSPHPSQHLTPDHTFDDGSKLSLGGFPSGTYRSAECHACSKGQREHSLQQMKRMGNHGGPMMGSSSMLADPNYQSEKGGILKKPGPYGPMDAAALEKDKWMEENAERFSRMDRMDRISTSSQNQLTDRGPPHIPHDARSLSEVERTLKSLNGYHEGILEALRSAAASSSHRGSNTSSGGGVGDRLPPPPPPHGGTSSFGAHRSSTASLSEELRKQLTEGYIDSYGRGGGGGGGGGVGGVMGGADLVAAMAATLKRSSREKLDNVQQQQSSDHDAPGPIRIRNLEDLIRQLEHSSRHMSPSGSEDIRESEAERHFRAMAQGLVSSMRNPPTESETDSIESIYKQLSGPPRAQNTQVSTQRACLVVPKNLNQDREDQAFGIGHYHHHTPSNSGAAGGTLGRDRDRDREAAHRRRSSAGGTGGPGSPVASHGSANSSLKFRSSRLSGLDGCGNRISPPRTPRAYGQVTGGAGAELFDPNGGVDTISPGDGGLTPGSTFDASEVDSEDYLRAQLMRSTSDEAVNSKSEDLEDDVDSIRSPFYKPRTPLRYPLSPQSPPSDESSYQGSIPGSAPSDRSYNGGGNIYTSGLSEGSRDSLETSDIQNALRGSGFYVPDYKH
ncbi:uncharacterized protein LOC131881812 isoform X4 [Tigriopus californicus]|uniref:uncharacterized protein LOC131881812 isoform X4 n=1 Tax=Tigriopus californicus TaxID=6832 RepID=UPI0027DA481E|nr:uncharacterized protein LOC131881812 isoform X4 [Tigriopus californicus]